jgi:hypothetical protein
METLEEDVGDVLANGVGIALDIREEGIEVNQWLGVHVLECSDVVSFEGINEEEGIGVDVEIGFGSIAGGGFGFVVEELAAGWAVVLENDLGFLVDLEARVETEHGGIGISIGWKPIEREASRFLDDPTMECFELVALEWSGVVVFLEGNDDAVFLDVGNVKAVV